MLNHISLELYYGDGRSTHALGTSLIKWCLP